MVQVFVGAPVPPALEGQLDLPATTPGVQSEPIVPRDPVDVVVGNVERVGPHPVRTDRVRTTPMAGRFDSKWPGAIGVDAVPKPVHVQGMRHVVGIPDVDLQPLTWARVDDCARNAPCVARLIDIGRDQLVGLGIK